MGRRSGSFVVDVPFTLAHPTLVDVTATIQAVSYTGDFAATPGVDFSLVSGSLVIPAGEQTGSVKVRVFGDGFREDPTAPLLFPGVEWVLLRITALTNATLAPDSTFFGMGALTIREDD